ncbi:MAG TPA: hypothetical protein VMW29_01645 [Candidatus Bathyarchaeia archaeon]|nr:hypothetical protein [Candidatus Bathyarchaeia archaeon]
MIKLGYSTGGKKNISLKTRIKKILEIENHALEVNFIREERLKEKIDRETLDLIKKFKYISFHAPALEVFYPSKKTEWIIEELKQIIPVIRPDVLVFHPDNVKDFNWLNKQFGKLLAFENMDSRKKFGKTIKDLTQVFKKSPQAKFVFDINHLYTVNPKLDLADKFYITFKKRLCHYHLSAYGGWHTCFCLEDEDFLLKAITDFSKPIIHEGGVVDKNLLLKENTYVLSRLVSNFHTLGSVRH